MFKKILEGIFNANTSTTLIPQETTQIMPEKEQNKEFHTQKSIEFSQNAREAFDSGDLDTSIELLNKANEHLVKTFAKSENEVRNAAHFYGVNKKAYLASKKIRIPIKGIKKEEMNIIHKEIGWFALNGLKADYSLMAFLMFREYEWKEFDEELQRAKNSNNPEEYGIYYFIKNELKEKVDLSVYREKFYSLSPDARILFASYNAISRKAYLKEEKDIETFYRERGSKELESEGYIHLTDKGLMIEFPVNEKKQVMLEKKKLETLMNYLLTLNHWKNEYEDGKSRFDKQDIPNAIFLVSGTGGSTLCKAEAIPVELASEKLFHLHSIGCKCHVSFLSKPERLSKKEKEKYGLKY